jgi:phosphoribosylformimino-5-aminoimidazole carboxamide ribotide isomerase
MRIIVALDILEGKCVRLTRGNFSTGKVYNENPLDVAMEIEDKGLKYLHLVDLDGAKNKRIINYRILEKIALKTSLVIDFGGGIRSDKDISTAFDSGANQVTAGSVAVTDPALFLEWLAKYGNDKIMLGADFIDRKIATHGWTQESDKDIITFLSEYYGKGVRFAVCTDVDKDGMMSGPSFELYKEILASVEINLIASGGITSTGDLEKLSDIGCEGAITGKAIYEGKIKLKELRDLC